MFVSSGVPGLGSGSRLHATRRWGDFPRTLLPPFAVPPPAPTLWTRSTQCPLGRVKQVPEDLKIRRLESFGILEVAQGRSGEWATPLGGKRGLGRREKRRRWPPSVTGG